MNVRAILFTICLSALIPFSAIAEEPLTIAAAAVAAVGASEELSTEYALAALKQGSWALGFRAYLPNVSLSAGEDDRLSLAGADSFTKTFGIQIEQLIWDGGRTKTSRLLESAELGLARENLNRKAREIAEAAVTAYRNVLAQRAYLAIKTASADYLREQRRILAVELETGHALREDLLQAEVSVGEAEVDAAATAIDLEEAERALAETLGMKALPPLADQVDVERPGTVVDDEFAAEAARASNPELAVALLEVDKARVEAREASRSWVPKVNLTGGASVNGDSYPLTRSSWSIGMNLSFSGPFLNGSAEAKTGWEPPYDRTASTSASATPLPDPAAYPNARSAEVALALRITLYDAVVEKSGRDAAFAAKQIKLADRRRALAREGRDLALRALELAELRRQLGRVTRIDLMKLRLDAEEKEVAFIQAAVALLAAERGLEKLLDLPPGELTAFAAREKARRGNR